MLPVILQFLISKFTSLTYIDKAYGLGEIVSVNGEEIASVYEDDELTHINHDNYNSLCYCLRNGDIKRETEEHPLLGCSEIITETYPIRLIIYTNGAEAVNCSSYSQSIAQGIKKALSGVQEDLRSATNADIVRIKITSTELDSGKVWKMQYSAESLLKDGDIMIAVDIEIMIKGNEQCFAGEPCTADTFVFDHAAQSFCNMVNQCSSIGKKPLFFYTEAGKAQYTNADVPGMYKLDGATIISVNMDGAVLVPSFYTTTGSGNTFAFELNGITPQGGEYIVIFWA